MTWVKICGITNLDDARVAVDAGADALGFVFYHKSPRRVDPETAREIIKSLPAEIEKLGVFVDEGFEQAGAMAETSGLTGVQLYRMEALIGFARARNGHGPESRRPKIVYAIAGEPRRETESLLGPDLGDMVDAVLFDSGSSTQPGGTGRAFNWTGRRAAVEAARSICPVIVAGGLTPDNVGEAMRILEPWGVDVCSGVEARPGKKDRQKIRALIAAVRKADQIA